jgi:hypothetical protein
MQCCPEEKKSRSALQSVTELEGSLPLSGCGEVVRMRVHRRSSRGQPTRGGSPVCAELVWAGGLLTAHRKDKAACYEILY